MSTDIDWQRELDSSFGAGHDVPPGHYVAAGRTAVRRRRATAAVLAAAVVIGGGTAWASGQDPAVRGDAPVATQGVDTEQRRVTVPTDPPDRLDRRVRQLDRMRRQAEKPDFLGEPAVLGADGLVLAPGAGPVLERVENPMGYTSSQGQSLGIRVMFRGREKYSLLTRDADGGTSMGTNDATGDFAGWLDGRVRSTRLVDGTDADSPDAGVMDTPDEWLSLAPDGSIASATPYVAVMEVREGVDLGSFATDADRAGVARLQVTGMPQYVTWRVVAGELEVVAAPGSHDSTNEFVSWARQQYASGEGMR